PDEVGREVLRPCDAPYVVYVTARAPSAISPLSLRDALPISILRRRDLDRASAGGIREVGDIRIDFTRHHVSVAGEQVHLTRSERSEEHTSELQSRGHVVCRLLLEKEKTPATEGRGHE